MIGPTFYSGYNHKQQCLTTDRTCTVMFAIRRCQHVRYNTVQESTANNHYRPSVYICYSTKRFQDKITGAINNCEGYGRDYIYPHKRRHFVKRLPTADPENC